MSDIKRDEGKSIYRNSMGRNPMDGNGMDRILIPIKMKLLSDTIFGNGMSIPGEEDISVLTDDRGFPYYKGSTFKGVFRDEMKHFLEWGGCTEDRLIETLFGKGNHGADEPEDAARRLVFSDFTLSAHVRDVIYAEIGNDPGRILDCLSNTRAFTRISEEGTAAKGSLRYARCVNQGLFFYSTISCSAKDEELVKEVLPFVKWIGTLRNRGFGHVRIEPEKASANLQETAETNLQETAEMPLQQAAETSLQETAEMTLKETVDMPLPKTAQTPLQKMAEMPLRHTSETPGGGDAR